MGNSNAKRIQNSLLGAAEKKLLVRIANRLPRWVTSDFLTWTGVAGAFICAIGYALGNIDIRFLWIASLGFVINWFGDSLDGTMARVRNTQRPTYGFFIDHSLDAFTICVMCIGAGLSPLFGLDIALFVLAGYLVISIQTYINTILKDEFLLNYGGFGPTEFRLVMVLINTAGMYLPWQRWSLEVCGRSIGFFNVIGIVILVILWSLNIFSFCRDLRNFAKIDPPKSYNSKRD